MNTQPLRLRYYLSVARAVGVPELWVPDAAQDIALICWRRGNSEPGTVRSAAIDCVRRYGSHSRYGVERVVCVPLDNTHVSEGDFTNIIIRMLDAARGWRLLSPRQRKVLTRRALGLSVGDATKSASDGSKKLRKLCA